MCGRISKIWIALLAVFVLDFSLCRANPIEKNGNSSKESSAGSITTYDQRQTGKYNVHVNIKDVQVFSISDSLSGIGGDYEEGDYGDYATLEGDDGSDYDISHLTVNPIFAFLGQSKPTTTTAKPLALSNATTTSVKPDVATTTEKSVTQQQEQQLSSDSSVLPSSSTTTPAASTTAKQDIESEASAPAVVEVKKPPQTSPTKVNETIDYEEIPVEVLYYRNQQNQMRKEQQHPQPVALRRVDTQSRLHHHNKRRPSVVIIDTHGRSSNNVKILEDHPIAPMVKICGTTEFRDKSGRCRSKYHRQLKRRDAPHLPGGL